MTDEDGVSKQHLGKTILFPFFEKPRLKELNPLFLKQNHISFIKDEISFKRVKEQLLQPHIKQKIQGCLDKIHITICADLQNAFWIENLAFLFSSG